MKQYKQGKTFFDNVEPKESQDKVSWFRVFLNGMPFQTLITVLTLFALFGDDIRVVAFRVDADSIFDIVNIVCIGMFIIEIILSVICTDGYFLSFFFFLDLISTVSLLLDIEMFLVAIGLQQSTATNTSGLARAGRASRVGTKAGRVVRLVRLIRIVKLYKVSANKKTDGTAVGKILERRKTKRNFHASQNDELGSNQPSVYDFGEEKQIDEESKVSKILSSLTTKKVIILVLILLFLIPLFDTSYYNSAPSSMQIQVEIFNELAQSNLTDFHNINQTYHQIILDHIGIYTPIMYFSSPFSFYNQTTYPNSDYYFNIYENSDFTNLRVVEQDVGVTTMNLQTIIETTPDLPEVFVSYFNQYQLYLIRNPTNVYVIGILSLRNQQVMISILSITRTVFISIVLTFGALMFSKDANDLALRPLERMISKLKKISLDPKLAKEQALRTNYKNNETIKIENTIIKIGQLLALGYGEAGSRIIKMNMARQGDIDPMIPGAKKMAIYGFCDIRNFTDATEVLQEEVMVFVNNIGEIVHTMADRYMGTANKNIGDAFLLVWPIRQDCYDFDDEDELYWHDTSYMTNLADCSLITFMKIQCKINREPKILAYRQDKRLLQRMDNYKVKMGLGLHMGWGIEGAIGSNFKIDASYLSPNVNMAARLEAATKQYGVPLLISNSLCEFFSSGVSEYIRQIDCVTVKGSIEPIGLYTIDMCVDNLPPSTKWNIKYPELEKEDYEDLLRAKKQDFEVQLINIQQYFKSGDFCGSQFFVENKDLALILSSFNKEFKEQFDLGFQKYIKGDWSEAKSIFMKALQLQPNDGPIHTLLDVMEEYNFIKPRDWKGYRELTEK